MKSKSKKVLFFSFLIGATTSLVSFIALTTACSTNNTNNTDGAIEPRSYDSNGLTTVTYDQEKYINKNSVSLLFNSTPNLTYVKNYVKSYVENATNKTDLSYKYMSYINYLLNINALLKYSNLTLGTGWILDYSQTTTNFEESIDSSNLVTYYIASNIHVLDASYTITWQVDANYSLCLEVPISKDSVTNLNVYLSQPQGSSISSSNNLAIVANDTSYFSKAWYKTNLTSSDIDSSFIPVGSLSSDGSSSNSTSYDMKAYLSPSPSNSTSYTYYYTTSTSITTRETSYSSTNNPSYSNTATTDFSVLKIQADPSAIKPTTLDTTYSTIFTNMTTMFNISTDEEDVIASSSYIAKLNYLNKMLGSSNIDTTKLDELFMFKDYTSLNSKSSLYIAGFPAIEKGEVYYANFNSNAIGYSKAKLIKNSSYFSSNNPRSTIEYNDDGKFYLSQYDWSNNLLLKNIDLKEGSSGSMVMDNDYKITGIYWGKLTSGTNVSSTTYGCVNTLFSKSNSSSTIAKYLKYIKQNDSNSQLLKLFTTLYNNGYFS